MVQRRTHLRSRKGCQTCKERHVRCDERLPYCGNCLRLGRECSYSQTLPQNHRNHEEPKAPTLAQASEQAWITKISPGDFQVYYCPPMHRDIPPSTISIIQESQELAKKRPLPRTCLMTIAQHYTPKYNLLAANFDCVKYSIVSFAAYMHYRATRSKLSQEVCIQHIGTALKQLQKDIVEFSPQNSDAVVTASIFLAGTAQDWEQWAIFVDGYSKAITQIIQSKLQTMYPDFCSSSLQLRQFSIRSNPDAIPVPISKTLMRAHANLVTDSILSVSRVFGFQRWRTVGFYDLEQLAKSVDKALAAGSNSETYHQMSWLRTWLFWMDLRKTNSDDEQFVLEALFYALILTVASLFPARYRESLVEVSTEKIRFADAELEPRWNGEFGLLELLDKILPEF